VNGNTAPAQPDAKKSKKSDDKKYSAANNIEDVEMKGKMDSCEDEDRKGRPSRRAAAKDIHYQEASLTMKGAKFCTVSKVL
jgi:hypothetical protein